MEAPPSAGASTEGSPTAAAAEVRCPGPTPLRLIEWKVAAGAAVRIGSVLAVCEAAASAQPSGQAPARATSGGCVRAARAERRLRSERAGVVRELCVQPGQVVAPGTLLVRLEGCSHPVVMKGLCAECGQDLTQLQSKNGKQQVLLSTATVSMVHSVPELMVSSEQAEKLAREDQQRLHRNRKLVLMVDLDQTLIHTTEQHCPQMSNKGIFHFQLGRGEPMLHTRLRPHCKDFLEKIAKLYELHVFTFGSRLYAHTIAGFLDPEKKLFSHRILSRDECIDPYSKTGNLRNLFPCGDSMVCIIDDREDVWKFAPNLITVKKYVYFPGAGDVNAPPGSREAQTRKKVNHSSKGTDVLEQVLPMKEPEECKPVLGVEQSNGLGKSSRELNGGEAVPGAFPSKTDEKDTWPPTRAPCTSSPSGHEVADATETPVSCEWVGRTTPGVQPTQGDSTQDLDFDLSSDSENSESSKSDSHKSSASDGESEKRGQKKSPAMQDKTKVSQHSSPPDLSGGRPAAGSLGESGPSIHPQDKVPDLDTQEESEQDSLCGLGNGCVDRKEAETESQNSEQSGVTAGESLDQSMGEEEEEDTDDDDHLIHLEEILMRVHTDYYTKYDRYLNKELEEAPDIRKIVPELKSKVLADVAVIFSGLHPTNFPVEKTREHYHATALGAKVLTHLVLSPDAPDRATHLIAARAGTEKVRQAQECRHLHVVSPDWLWSCLERWDKVEEQLFPLIDDDTRAHSPGVKPRGWCHLLLGDNSPAAFPDRQNVPPTALFHPTPIHPKAQPGPEVRIYDSHTGKLIRMGTQGPAPAPPSAPPIHGDPSSFRAVQPHQQQMFGEELPEAQDGEHPGPARRKRQPSMSETMPLYTLCKEDLESMDKEVDDILGEGSDDSDSEKKKTEDQDNEQERVPKPRKPRVPGIRREQPLGSSSSERSASGMRGPRGHKRKLNEEDAASESSGESSNDDEEASSSEADEMAAALEAELNDLM
ncbi:RNA polymerase II subunit A C-terminal domain phosphatase isoform X3 [Nannospalax galili]|uniref:RNA polymerase II subunit A C-terminal domain phosphatase isoform X3 n=1 Tax=Nannospalax galili TaxID=1026970 RepID=UPI00111C8537|nr:RNA polymerase II subunit A C-terminal domain phosphatase isoform X3 [Nannospalax galili]